MVQSKGGKKQKKVIKVAKIVVRLRNGAHLA